LGKDRWLGERERRGAVLKSEPSLTILSVDSSNPGCMDLYRGGRRIFVKDLVKPEEGKDLIAAVFTAVCKTIENSSLHSS
jgi:hypothetical protein